MDYGYFNIIFTFFTYWKYTFTQSIFEATSGYSTTGLTVVDVEQST
jgi:Trk-type K+ transport system membrane component